MDWRGERPVNEGVYWVRFTCDRKTRHWAVNINRNYYNGVLYVDGVGPLSSYGRGDESVAGARYEWFGPLAPPP